MFDKIRLVWNLTRRCSQNCAHCAAAAVPLHVLEDPTLKFRIFNSILTANCETSIDFSGGNPWDGEYAVELMKLASNVLGRENISISGLGSSVLNYLRSHPNFLDIAGEYSFTYDASMCYWYRRSAYDLSRWRADDKYRFDSLFATYALRYHGQNAEIALPIYNYPEEFYNLLAIEFNALRPKVIRLLQLMPLGRCREYHPGESSRLADFLISRLRDGGYQGSVTKNCAMIGRCNGFSDLKLGLDQDGNLYWCIWAADLPEKRERNPFYLGNLLNEPLLDILNRNRDQAECIARDKCHVLDFIESRLP